jgi:hypothetical protein
MDRQADMIAAQCLVQVTDPTTGEVTVKARNLAMLAQSVRLQAAAAELLVKHGVMALNLGRMEELYATVIEEIGKADRGVQQAVVARLRELNERRGGADKFGLGAAPATETADF